MRVDDETFFAWLDGELDAESAAKVERAVMDDPDLSARARQHRLLADGLRNAFDPILSMPVDPRNLGLGEADDSVIDLNARRDRSRARPNRYPLWGQVAALAATLALGIVTGTMLVGGNGGGIVESEKGVLVASASLDKALSTQLASAPEDNAATRIGLTFRDREGAVCRTFSSQAADGLACRKGDDWRIEGLIQQGAGQDTAYRMASGTSPALAALVDGRLAGDPFDAEQEKAAKAAGWR